MVATYHEILQICKINCYPIFLDALDDLSWHTYTVCFTLACKRRTCATPQGHGHLFIFVLEVLSCAIFVILRKLGRLEGAQAHLSLWTHSLSPSLSLVISRCLFMFQLHLSPSPPLQSSAQQHYEYASADKLCESLNNRAVTGFPSVSVLSLSLWLFSAHTGR